MSRMVIIEVNKDGKIELTKDELQKMLDDAYDQGYVDGDRKYNVITYPNYNYPNIVYSICNGDTTPLQCHL